MRRERKKRLTPAELKAASVSREVVVRKIRKPNRADSSAPNGPGIHGRGKSARTYNTSERVSKPSGGVGPSGCGNAASDEERGDR